MRLALKCGIQPQQIDSFHDSLTSEQIDEYRALAVIDGWYQPRSLETELRAELHNQTNRTILAQYSSQAEAERAAEKMDWKSGSDYLIDFKPKKKKQKNYSVNQFRRIMEARHGNHNQQT
jgi:hypothetical protein